jgi:hypothetical protein
MINRIRILNKNFFENTNKGICAEVNFSSSFENDLNSQGLSSDIHFGTSIILVYFHCYRINNVRINSTSESFGSR